MQADVSVRRSDKRSVAVAMCTGRIDAVNGMLIA
jgi:hypothetical protein